MGQAYETYIQHPDSHRLSPVHPLRQLLRQPRAIQLHNRSRNTGRNDNDVPWVQNGGD